MRLALRLLLLNFATYPLIIIGILSVLLSIPVLQDRLQFNRTAGLALSVFSDDQLDAALALEAQSRFVALAQDTCRAYWYAGILSHALDNPAQQDLAWTAAIQCDPEVIQVLPELAPQNLELAQFVVSQLPQEAVGWFWLAQFYLQSDTERAVGLYARGLALSPHDGLRWREMGDLLVQRDPRAALDAYLQSCLNGDPGSNGCWRAGKVAEEMGDIPHAIGYYRLSHWFGALDRASALEQSLQN